MDTTAHHRRLLAFALLLGSTACVEARSEAAQAGILAQEATVEDDSANDDSANDDSANDDSDMLPGLGGPRDIDGSGCTLPPDCKDLRTIGFNVNVCCTKQVACGIDLSPLVAGLPESGLPAWAIRQLIRETLPKGTDLNKPCLPAAALWVPTPSLPDRRVQGAPNEEVVLAARCPSRALIGFPLYGCCMPDNKCGLSTHYPLSDFRSLSKPGFEGPFEFAKCAPPADINKWLGGTTVAQFAQIPPTTGSCNHAALRDKLPPPAPLPE